MKQEESCAGKIIVAIAVTAIIAGGGVYYLQKIKIEQLSQRIAVISSKKSLVEYYKTRTQFHASGMAVRPENLGLKEIAQVNVACPANADGPCGATLHIVSKDALHSGDQEFYLAQMGGAGYSYYGPFQDDLGRMVGESDTIAFLNDIY